MLLRPKFIFVIAVIGTGLILVLLPSPLNEKLKRAVGWIYLPLIGAAEGIEETGRRSREYLTPRSSLISELERLRIENHHLRIREFQLTQVQHENDRLRALIEWKKGRDWDLRLARVVVKDPSNWWHSITLNVGTKKGVSIHDPVFTEKGLVGKVIGVGPSSSRIALVGDPHCQVAAEIDSPKKPRGIVTPTSRESRNRHIAELKYFPSNSIDELKPGTKVLTSGTGGIFPKGIPIGTVIDSQPRELGLYSGARIRLSVSLDSLDLTWVLARKSSKEHSRKDQ